MEITRNTTSGLGGSVTYSVFEPMRQERAGKYGFKVEFVGRVTDCEYHLAFAPPLLETQRMGHDLQRKRFSFLCKLFA